MPFTLIEIDPHSLLWYRERAFSSWFSTICNTKKNSQKALHSLLLPAPTHSDQITLVYGPGCHNFETEEKTKHAEGNTRKTLMTCGCELWVWLCECIKRARNGTKPFIHFSLRTMAKVFITFPAQPPNPFFSCVRPKFFRLNWHTEVCIVYYGECVMKV